MAAHTLGQVGATTRALVRAVTKQVRAKAPAAGRSARTRRTSRPRDLNSTGRGWRAPRNSGSVAAHSPDKLRDRRRTTRGRPSRWAAGTVDTSTDSLVPPTRTRQWHTLAVKSRSDQLTTCRYVVACSISAAGSSWRTWLRRTLPALVRPRTARGPDQTPLRPSAPRRASPNEPGGSIRRIPDASVSRQAPGND